MKIVEATLQWVALPLRTAFKTAVSTISKREILVAKLRSENGTVGYGEVSSFTTPWYTSETLYSDWELFYQVLQQELLQMELSHPSHLTEKVKWIKGHPMLIAGVETALWDIYGKETNQSLFEMMGGKKESVSVGVAIGASTIEECVQQASKVSQQGYERMKFKMIVGQEIALCDALRTTLPEASLMFDANGAYDERHMELLKELDSYDLLMMEQPFPKEKWLLYKQLQREIQTPLCLDESLESLDDMKLGIELRAFQIANVKYARLGGITNALNMLKYGKRHHIVSWTGGMLESGISKAVTIALASREECTIAGDITASHHFWLEDIIDSPFTIENGTIRVRTNHGIGVTIDEEKLAYYTISK